jgi:hypothetical protein
MAMWRFWDYFTEDHRCPIRDWYGAQDPAVQAAFDVVVLILRDTEDWTASDVEEFKRLEEPHVGLSEIRFQVDVPRRGNRNPYKRHFRPAGLYRPEERDFVFLVGCEKSGRIYTPADAFDQALRYKTQFESGLGVTDDHRF